MLTSPSCRGGAGRKHGKFATRVVAERMRPQRIFTGRGRDGSLQDARRGEPIKQDGE